MVNSKNANNGCCSCGSGCCDSKEIAINKTKSVIIDFLYLDLDTCTRCQGTDTSLDEAIYDVTNVLKASGYEVIVNKINVSSEGLAIKYRFISSPTIRVNGKDIQMEIKESLCESCGDICGDNVDCRVWIFGGEEYTVPPKAMIVEGILKRVFGEEIENDDEKVYIIPENLKKFYSALNSKSESKHCCGSENSDSCC